MEHYVTIFDRLFIPQGLALHMSMERHLSHYKLWILCADDETYTVLSKLTLTNVSLLQLSQLESDDLRRVKSSRSKVEYYWTVTPFAPRYVFDADANVNRVTYLDADLWFLQCPDPIFQELDACKKGVLITDHGYAPENDQSQSSGQYCVQFLTFHRDKGEKVRKSWEAKCLEWCHARHEDGKFGDQKYLEDWPKQFPDQTHVLTKQKYALAPWNVTRFSYSNAIFYHFHSYRYGKYVQYSQHYRMPKVIVNTLYKRYDADIFQAIKTLKEVSYIAPYQHNLNPVFEIMKSIFRQIFRSPFLKTRYVFKFYG